MRELDDLLSDYLVGGDEDAMTEIVARTRPRLVNAVRHLPDAEDAVQAAYLALLQAQPPGSVGGWLYTTTVRIAYRNKARLAREEAIVRQLGLETSKRRDIEVDAEFVRNEVARLPANFRDPVILCHLNGLTTAEVAKLLGVEPATVRTRLHRGRGLLRNRLGPRVAYSLFFVPWLVRDAGGVALEGVLMSKKAGAIGVILLALLTAGVLGIREHSNGSSERADTRGAATGEVRTSIAGPRVVDEGPNAAPTAYEVPDVSGIVVDLSGDAVASVAVIACKDNQTYFRAMRWIEPQEVGRQVARTDANGRFAVQELGATRSLIFFKAGHVPVGLDAAAEMRVVLRPARSITALVRDTSGRAIAGACVAASGTGLNQRVFTGADGRVTLETVPLEEEIRVSANGLGYVPDMPSRVAREMTFTLKRMGLIISAVDAETGEPVADAQGVFFKHAEPAQLSTAVDPSSIPGFFREQPGQLYRPIFADPTADGVVVDAHIFADGYVPHVTRVSWKRDAEPPRMVVRLRRGRGTASLNGRASSRARIEIRMRWRGYRNDVQTHTLVTVINTDEEGRFEFAGLPAGEYRLVASAVGHGPVGLDVDVPAHDVWIDLPRAASLDLTARNSTGAPVANYWFHIETRDGRRMWEFQTDAGGHAVADGLTPGELVVFPLRAPGEIISNAYDWDRVELTLKAGERRSRSIVVPVQHAVAVHLRDEDGNSLPGVEVVADAQGGYAFHRSEEHRGTWKGVTNDEGIVRLVLWPGVYEGRATVGTARVRNKFVVAVAGPHQVELVATIGGAVLVGKVVESETDAAIEGAHLDAWSGGNRCASGRTNANGEFMLRGVPSGKVRLVVRRKEAHESIGMMWREIEMPVGGTKSIKFHVPALRGPTASMVPFSVLVRDAASQRTLQAISVQLRGRHRGTWIALGAYFTDSHGRVEGTVVDVGRTTVLVGAGMFGYAKQELQPASLAAMQVELTRSATSR